MSYRARLEAMCQGLRRHKQIKLTQAFLGPPVPEYELASFRHQAGGQLSEGLEAFWREVSYVDIAWSCPNPIPEAQEETLTGSVHLLAPSKVFGPWRDIIWFDFVEEEHPYRALRPLDFFVPEACAALYPIPGEHEIAYHVCGEELHPTGLSFAQWFERMMMARGCWYWIEACCVDGQGSPQTEQFLEAMPRLFDDFEAELFKPLTTRGEIPS